MVDRGLPTDLESEILSLRIDRDAFVCTRKLGL